MASAGSSLSLFIARITSTILIVCVVFVASANIVNPHRFHNRLFRPPTPAQRDRHRARRDDCREDDWETMTFAGRIANGDSDAIMQGTVDRLISWGNPSRTYPGRGVYTAEVTLDCIYKGWGYPDRVNISGFGNAPYDCVDSHVVAGKSYIFLVKKIWGLWNVWEFNGQSGVVEVTRYTDSAVKSLYPCRAPSEVSVPSYYSGSEDSYSFDVFSSPGDYEMYDIDAYDGSESTDGSICPAYDFFSFLSVSALYGGDYYDYDKDGLSDYCRFLNTASKSGDPCKLLLTLSIAFSFFCGFL